MALRIEDFEKDTALEDTDPGLVDPVLKCIQGDYMGRYVYLSNCGPNETETKGIVIGGGKPQGNKKEIPRHVNIFLEDPRLDQRHLHIFCRKKGPLN